MAMRKPLRARGQMTRRRGGQSTSTSALPRFVFPRSELIRVTGEPYNGVMGILVTNRQIQVMTFEGTGNSPGGIWDLYGI
jgi:hypothetical protein